MATAIITNPFPVEAVATYGHALKTCDTLPYMREAKEYLTDYLNYYPKSKERYGAAVGIRGGHGSGKTHLLTWLAETARAMSTLQPAVLYAKADSANFYNLYSQLMIDLSREQLQHHLSFALKNIAIELVEKAKATEGLKERIKRPEDLPQLYAEESLARDQLLQALRERLEATQVPLELPRTLLQIDSPSYGQKAYEWLLGRDVKPLEELRLNHNLLEIKDERGNADPDTMVVNALETIAAMLNQAECPLIVLIDQMEILFRVEDQQRRETLYSVIKKLIEQLKRQNALLFIAGTNDAWDAVPRDVTPRLRSRKHLRVGSLSRELTKFFLDSFTKDAKSFTEERAWTIRELSGGNPREILRIAHHAFRRVDGDLENVSDTVLIECAKDSGSIADRHQQALLIAEGVLKDFGTTLKRLQTDEGEEIDFLLMVERVPLLAIVSAKATDKLSEVDSARRVHSIRAYIEKQWPTAQLVVVSVGYSSREVAELLSTTSTVMQFDELQYAEQLRAKATEAVAQMARPQQPDTADNQIVETLKKLTDRLNQLEATRSEEAEKVVERFKDKAEELSRPETEKRATLSRWDMRDALDSLEETLLKGWESWTSGHWRTERWRKEREQIKSILVSNESYLGIHHLNRVGDLYQDLLGEERGLWKELDRLEVKIYGFEVGRIYPIPSFSDVSHSERAKDPRWLLSELMRVRRQLIKIMRRLLQEPGIIERWQENPPIYAFIPATIVLVLCSAAVSVMKLIRSVLVEPPFVDLFFQKILPLVIISYGLSVGILYLLRWMRTSSWEEDVRRVKRMIREYEDGYDTPGPMQRGGAA